MGVLYDIRNSGDIQNWRRIMKLVITETEGGQLIITLPSADEVPEGESISIVNKSSQSIIIRDCTDIISLEGRKGCQS